MGPALYLGGNAVFNHALSRRVPRSRVLGLGALAVTAPLTLVLTPVAVLVVVAVITVVLALGTGTPRRAVPHR